MTLHVMNTLRKILMTLVWFPVIVALLQLYSWQKRQPKEIDNQFFTFYVAPFSVYEK